MFKNIYYDIGKRLFAIFDKFKKNCIKVWDTTTLQDFEPSNNQANEIAASYYTPLKNGVVYENNNGKEVYLYPHDMSQEELIEIIKDHRQDELLYSRF